MKRSTIEDTLTAEELRAIGALKRLAKRWPKSLWLFSAGGTLHVMKKNEDGEQAHLARNPGLAGTEGLDPAWSVATVGIQNDGGDW